MPTQCSHDLFGYEAVEGARCSPPSMAGTPRRMPAPRGTARRIAIRALEIILRRHRSRRRTWEAPLVPGTPPALLPRGCRLRRETRLSASRAINCTSCRLVVHSSRVVYASWQA